MTPHQAKEFFSKQLKDMDREVFAMVCLDSKGHITHYSEIYATLKTEKYNEAERMIHRSIDRISELRINKSREFFNISPEKAYEILSDIKDLIGDEAEVELFGDNVEIKGKGSSNKVRGEIFDFFKKGLKKNDIINFVDDPNIKPMVANNRQVFFEGEKWYLSALARELYTRMGTVSDSGSYQGPAYFEYNGEKLKDLPNVK